MAEKSERAQKPAAVETRAGKEEKILQFWEDNKIFKKSLEKKSPKGEFVFYDGPPFATGLPHYGHILPGTIKDVIPRYKTMRGYHVLRRWGWDCHGLPIENLIETELGLKTKKDIEKFGIAEFNSKARASVLRFEKEWKEIIPRTGRWIDMDNAYKTMDSSYIESVWWSFKNLYDKGLIYQSFKPMHLCPHCETTLSNFEVNQGYKDITDLAVTVKFESMEKPGAYLLAWTTTPWTLPGNVALAVNLEIEYVEVTGEVLGSTYILASSRVQKVFGEKHQILKKFLGRDLVGKKYKTIFDYYQKEGQVYGADFVSEEEGTGIVHIAPAFGEDDYNLSIKNKLPFIQHVGMDGRFKPEVTDFAGEQVKPKDDHQVTDIKIIKYLAGKNLLFAKEKVVHSYPHCWRCETPLINYATYSWFLKVTDIKDKIIKNNKKVGWVPEDIRDGRFGKWLEGARDWAISRSRFWGTPIPVWQTADGSKRIVVDSVETLKKYSKTKMGAELDLHRPYIDEIILEKDGEEYGRVKEVFDTWYDSGSVPFASRAVKELIPADFIAEGLDQTRGWFYTLTVLSTALFNKSPYKQVVTNGLILAEDGKKMSKRLKNYPELTEVLDKYGADALRYYLISSQAVRAEDLAFSEKGLDEVAKKIITRLDNVVSFYELYKTVEARRPQKGHILDRWIDARLGKLKEEVTQGLERYELDRASRPINEFVDDLSTWYLRRSRTRPEALPKLRQILIEFSKILAPFMPFQAEDIYQRMRSSDNEESVHLEDWPKLGKVDKNILDEMRETRAIVSLGLEARSKANIKVRQPLQELRIKNHELGKEFLELIQDELNVKKVTVDKNLGQEVELDTNLTPELIEEGRVRDAIRVIQDMRKEKGLKPKDKMKFAVPAGEEEFFKKHADEIGRATNVEF
jgi:isoleucyl-tRNA synthetase